MDSWETDAPGSKAEDLGEVDTGGYGPPNTRGGPTLGRPTGVSPGHCRALGLGQRPKPRCASFPFTSKDGCLPQVGGMVEIWGDKWGRGEVMVSG